MNVLEEILNWVFSADKLGIYLSILILVLYFSNKYHRKALLFDLDQKLDEKLNMAIEKKQKLVIERQEKEMPQVNSRPYFVLELSDDNISEPNGYLSICLRNIGNSNASSIALKYLSENELFKVKNKSANVMLRGYFEKKYVMINDDVKLDILIRENEEKTNIGELSDNITFKICYNDIFDRVYEQEFSFNFSYTYGMLKNVKETNCISIVE